MEPRWTARIGAVPTATGTQFRIWAQGAQRVELLLEDFPESTLDLEPQQGGWFERHVPGCLAGQRYRYRVDGRGPFPDPLSRFQPEGVHQASQVIDPNGFVWTDTHWKGLDRDRLVIYELHLGTFTPAGTFAAAQEKLRDLRDLGVTAVELMPVADFPGQRGWGYDGVSLFAPARCYGTPDDFRLFVDHAHAIGVGVILDVVYNHLGPDGNYIGMYSSYYYSPHHDTPWGKGLNLDDEHSQAVRAILIENTRHWIEEYHLDGIRYDATHAIQDQSPQHLFAELSGVIRQAERQSRKSIILIAEDERNERTIVLPVAENGWGFDGIWADDFHHQIRRATAGDHHGYYQNYTGESGDIASTIKNNWYYTGQPYANHHAPRGTPAADLAAERFIVCIQNHDQIGNRAFGERLHHQIDPAAYRAVSALLLLAPQTPLLFMGQEWAATTPFQYFTDHHEELGRLVTAGRRREFQQFPTFADDRIRAAIPDPQARETFQHCKLNWSERERPAHQRVNQLYRELLRLRSQDPALQPQGHVNIESPASGAILMRRSHPASDTVLSLLVSLKPGVTVAFPNSPGQVFWTSEAEHLSELPRRPQIVEGNPGIVVHCPAPVAILFRS